MPQLRGPGTKRCSNKNGSEDGAIYDGNLPKSGDERDDRASSPTVVRVAAGQVSKQKLNFLKGEYQKQQKVMTTNRCCLALDLKDDPKLIAAYDDWHKAENGWQEVRQSIEAAGIHNMEIYRTGNRLFMIMETDGSFDRQHKAELDAANPKVQEWETLMWKFQQPLPWAKEGEKWVEMQKIFEL